DAIWYLDADRDGYGTESITLEQCNQPAGYVQLQTFDCDDTNADLSPGEVEVCDGIDNNCDGLIDDADGAVVPDKVWFIDSDGDGHGSSNPSAATLEQCDQPAGYSADSNDCDDSTTDIGPHVAEVCDSIDQDCDGLIDEGVEEAWFVDSDQDGFGDGSISPQYACLDAGPSDFVLDNTDCNDNTNTAYPGADEFCDSIDNNCNGVSDEASAIDATTWYLDDDGDGLIDSDDPECTSAGVVLEASACTDGQDNDGDGWYDSEDPDCAIVFDETGFDFNGPACNNSQDDDGDGYTDAQDGGCATASDNDETDTCSDLADNDSDGWVDSDDPD
ncbi:MAG: putative metal-binding motif-containing protein, partial [Myxococcota bacterium]|nr:putative metal-binding motif-containing protein [Myxococcota bacterium]